MSRLIEETVLDRVLTMALLYGRLDMVQFAKVVRLRYLIPPVVVAMVDEGKIDVVHLLFYVDSFEYVRLETPA